MISILAFIESMPKESGRKSKRTSLNVQGDFYVEKDMCLICKAPENVAPDLMGYDSETGCYFKKQPETPEELDRAIEAVRVSCVEALRYAGDEPAILKRLQLRRCETRCDALSSEGNG